jgi:hypothetical protein
MQMQRNLIKDANFSVKWYRSTFYNALILGLCNFLAPGIWGAMNSLGGGGEEKPYLVNAYDRLIGLNPHFTILMRL